MEVVWILDQELLLRGIPFFANKPDVKYVDDGELTSLVFKDRNDCPSVDIGSCADFTALANETPVRYAFAILTAGQVRARRLGEVVHNPMKNHYSHALLVPPPELGKKMDNWRRGLRDLVWDLVFIPDRVEQFRTI